MGKPGDWVRGDGGWISVKWDEMCFPDKWLVALLVNISKTNAVGRQIGPKPIGVCRFFKQLAAVLSYLIACRETKNDTHTH